MSNLDKEMAMLETDETTANAESDNTEKEGLMTFYPLSDEEIAELNGENADVTAKANSKAKGKKEKKLLKKKKKLEKKLKKINKKLSKYA